MNPITLPHLLLIIGAFVIAFAVMVVSYVLYRVKLNKILYFDSLTHGYNFEAFKNDFDKKSKTGYVIAMDIDNFFSIENVCGAETADQIIIGVWDVIDHFFLKNDVFCRISGDNFAFYLEPRNEGDLEWQISNLVKKLKEFAKSNHYPSLEVVFGVYKCSRDDQAQTAYLKSKYALKKMNHASRRYIYYYEREDEFNQRIEDLILHGFKEAIENNEFKLEFQPKFDRKSGQITGAESLVRWNHDGKIYYPNDIIKSLEKNGYIYQLDSYVFEEVVKFQARRMQQNLKTIPISVNISHRSLYYGNVVEEYRTLLHSYRVDSRMVPLEISGVSLDEDSRIIDVTKRFSHYDFSLHIANYGIGNTPLAVLSEMDFDTVKIDRRLTFNIEDIRTNKIVRNIVNMARDLHKRVVVVGVETPTQSEIIRELGVDELQGFYYSKPMDADLFSKLLQGYIYESFTDQGFSVIARESITTAYNLSNVSDGMLSLMIGTSGVIVLRDGEAYISKANENMIKALGIKCGNREKLDHYLPVSDYLYQKEMPNLYKLLDMAYKSGSSTGPLRFMQPRGSLYTNAVVFFKGESFLDKEYYIFLTTDSNSTSEHETLSNLPYGVLKYRADTEVILEMSDSLLKMMGFESFEEFRNTRGSNITDYIYKEDYESAKFSVKEQADRMTEIINLTYRIVAKDGTLISVEDLCKIVFDEDNGYIAYCAVSAVDDSTFKANYDLQLLKHSSTHDGLTGLVNQTTAHEMVQSILQEHPNTEYAMMILDVDDFKQVNDTIGHSGGDEALKEFGKRIASLTNNNGLCARIGGDEFLIIEPLILEDELAAVKRVYDELHFVVSGHSITPSIGVSSTTSSERSYVDLFLNADRALYHTKKNGKDGYSVFNEEMPIVEDIEAEKTKLESVTYDSIINTIDAFSNLTENYLFVLDLNNDKIYVSSRTESDFDISNNEEASASKKIAKIVYPDDYIKLAESVDAIRRGDDDGHNFVYRWVEKNGSPVWIHCRGNVIRNDSKPKFLVGIVERIRK